MTSWFLLEIHRRRKLQWIIFFIQTTQMDIFGVTLHVWGSNCGYTPKTHHIIFTVRRSRFFISFRVKKTLKNRKGLLCLYSFTMTRTTSSGRARSSGNWSSIECRFFHPTRFFQRKPSWQAITILHPSCTRTLPSIVHFRTVGSHFGQNDWNYGEVDGWIDRSIEQWDRV